MWTERMSHPLSRTNGRLENVRHSVVQHLSKCIFCFISRNFVAGDVGFMRIQHVFLCRVFISRLRDDLEAPLNGIPIAHEEWQSIDDTHGIEVAIENYGRRESLEIFSRLAVTVNAKKAGTQELCRHLIPLQVPIAAIVISICSLRHVCLELSISTLTYCGQAGNFELG